VPRVLRRTRSGAHRQGVGGRGKDLPNSVVLVDPVQQHIALREAADPGLEEGPDHKVDEARLRLGHPRLLPVHQK